MKPLIDEALPKGLIDFVDFHAYDIHASPEVCCMYDVRLLQYRYMYFICRFC